MKREALVLIVILVISAVFISRIPKESKRIYGVPRIGSYQIEQRLTKSPERTVLNEQSGVVTWWDQGQQVFVMTDRDTVFEVVGIDLHYGDYDFLSSTCDNETLAELLRPLCNYVVFFNPEMENDSKLKGLPLTNLRAQLKEIPVCIVSGNLENWDKSLKKLFPKTEKFFNLSRRSPTNPSAPH